MQSLRSRRFKLFICCGTPEAIACLVFNYPNLGLKAHNYCVYVKWLYNKMDNNYYRNEAESVMVNMVNYIL